MPCWPANTSCHSDTTFSTTMPKPIVTMASAGPFTRSAGSAITTPNRPAMTPEAANASHGFQPSRAVSSAAVYAPTANSPACPSDFCPAWPTSTLSPAAAR